MADNSQSSQSSRIRQWLSVFFCTLFVLTASGEETRSRVRRSGPLYDYVQKPDSSYSWKVKKSGSLLNREYAELILTSQTWRGSAWKHQLFIINPKSAKKSNRHALLFITGGSWKPELESEAGKDLPREAGVFAALAEQLQSPVAVLLHVPFQPLFDGRKEDAIIALTFKNFMETGDNDWPLLLPMVKSAVRAMDTVQTYAKDNWGQSIDSFTLSGASKRGWTTWLTGAVDERAGAIAPMVIDMLNMSPQMKHQKKAWGDLSYKINDYTELNLVEKLDTDAGRALAAIVDPYQYRAALTQPKLILLGTNDHYWPLDALNLYWNGLLGDKHVLYVPNNRHSLRDLGRVTGSLLALHHHSRTGQPLPKLNWEFETTDAGLALRVTSDRAAKTMNAWYAVAPTRDFRPAVWKSAPLEKRDGSFEYLLKKPAEGYAAVFAEAVYEGQSVPYYLSTTVRIIGSSAANPSK